LYANKEIKTQIGVRALVSEISFFESSMNYKLDFLSV